jgi:hypothetical protein
MRWRAGLVPLVVREWFRLAVYDFCDRNGVLIRPIGEIHENAAGFCGDADTGHLLVRKTSDLVEICGGDERSDKRKREGKVNPHKTDSPLVPGPDDRCAKHDISQNLSLPTRESRLSSELIDKERKRLTCVSATRTKTAVRRGWNSDPNFAADLLLRGCI